MVKDKNGNVRASWDQIFELAEIMIANEKDVSKDPRLAVDILKRYNYTASVSDGTFTFNAKLVAFAIYVLTRKANPKFKMSLISAYNPTVGNEYMKVMEVNNG